MRKLFFGIMIFIFPAVFCAAAGIADEAKAGNVKAEMSYAFGMVVASDLRDTGLEFSYNSFMQGFREYMEDQETTYTLNEAMDKIQAAYMAAQAEIGEQNRIEGEAFLAQNGSRSGVVTTPSGLQYEVITEGTGESPGPNDTVLVHYQGSTINGEVFDSTEGYEPMEIPLYNVIPGWTEGLGLMKKGGKAMLYIPPNLGYGERGAGIAIGPNSVLIFEVELLDIVRSNYWDDDDDEDY